MHRPRQDHWDAALRVLCYIKHTPGQGFFLRLDSDLQLHAECYSDWASYPITRRSLTGFFISIGHSPISWKPKKQQAVSYSSVEAEYRSMAITCCVLKQFLYLLQDLRVPQPLPNPLYCDNQASLHISSNPFFNEWTKHIEIAYHFIRNEIQAQRIALAYTPTNTQLADIFTKVLGQSQFHSLCKLDVRNLHATH